MTSKANIYKQQDINGFGKIGLLLSLNLILLFAYLMWEKPLWGYLPLGLFIGIWIFFTSIFLIRTKHPKEAMDWLKSALYVSSFMTLGFPPFIFLPALLIGLVPILKIESQLAQNNQVQPWLLFKKTFPIFWLWNILTTFWVANSALVAGFIANVINATLMTLPFIIFHISSHKIKSNWKYIGIIPLWLGFEILHHHWDITWPWLTLGNSLGGAYYFAQWFEYTGSYGGSIWILIMNIFAFLLWENRNNVSKKFIYLASIILVVPIVFSLFLYFNFEEKGEPIKALIIQPNYEPHYQKFIVPEYEQIKKINRLIQAKISQNLNIILLPETTFDPVILNDFYSRNSSIQSMVQMLNEYPNTAILTGIGAYRVFPNNPNRPTIRQSEGIFYEMYNAATILTKDTSSIQTYNKSKFVPGAEHFPFKNILFFLKPLIHKLGGSVAGFYPEGQTKNLVFFEKKIAPIICYESIYGSWVADFAKNGAGIFSILTNDGWWGNTQGYRQHLEIGRLRAIENRRDIFRSANTGISCLINQRGDITLKTGYEQDDAIIVKGHYQTDLTFYSKYGDLIPFIFVIICAIFYAIILLNFWIKKYL